MLTVIVAFDGSRNSSTCRPLASRYSVMPSTVVTRVTPWGNCVWAATTALKIRASASAQARTASFMSIPRYCCSANLPCGTRVRLHRRGLVRGRREALDRQGGSPRLHCRGGRRQTTISERPAIRRGRKRGKEHASENGPRGGTIDHPGGARRAGLRPRRWRWWRRVPVAAAADAEHGLRGRRHRAAEVRGARWRAARVHVLEDRKSV